MANPYRVEKVCKVKYVLIPSSKVKTPKEASSGYRTKKRSPIVNPLFAIDKRRHYYERHEAVIAQVFAKCPKLKLDTFHAALSVKLPHVTIELSSYVFKRHRRVHKSPLQNHFLYDPVNSIKHQEYITTLINDHPGIPKYRIIKRLKQRFPTHRFTTEFVRRYLENMPQIKKKSQVRKAAFSQSEFGGNKRKETTIKESVFYPENSYSASRVKKADSPDLEQSLTIKKILLSYKSPDSLQNIAPLNKKQFLFLVKLIRNYPKMEIKTYVTTLQAQFPQLEKAMTMNEMIQYIHGHFKDLLYAIKSNKKFNPPLTKDQAAFISSQLKDYPSKNIHHIFTALAAEFPNVTTFNYNTVKTFIQNNTSVDEFTRRLPRAVYRSFRDCHRRFLDDIYSKSPETSLTRAYSDMLIAFPDDYVGIKTIDCYVCNVSTDQRESD
jgi:hypothetical protein